jgi:hypothetical protein
MIKIRSWHRILPPPSPTPVRPPALGGEIPWHPWKGLREPRSYCNMEAY